MQHTRRLAASWTKRRTSLKARVGRTSALLVGVTPCQRRCSSQHEAPLDSQLLLTIGDTQRTTQTLTVG